MNNEQLEQIRIVLFLMSFLVFMVNMFVLSNILLGIGWIVLVIGLMTHIFPTKK
jgi:membrane-bound ClpP family serine protease